MPMSNGNGNGYENEPHDDTAALAAFIARLDKASYDFRSLMESLNDAWVASLHTGQAHAADELGAILVLVKSFQERFNRLAGEYDI